jgi:hypothetical protein
MITYDATKLFFLVFLISIGIKYRITVDWTRLHLIASFRVYSRFISTVVYSISPFVFPWRFSAACLCLSIQLSIQIYNFSSSLYNNGLVD